MHRLRPPAAIAASALALWLALPAYVNYDTAWSLVWGRELARGTEPNLEALSAPTPHPLTQAPTDGRIWIWPQDADSDGMFVARFTRR